ncbi:hypothetical protein DLM78_14920 [Leptospira stimsonii]|uniref:Uncharacterized protein n=1 Tax=Leptospira stimsonii TaxID=2202203 RepID=A0A8B3CP82_9LEPT|nr:hypothetical protein DLM78_14920 [Leptospira stimsonii]
MLNMFSSLNVEWEIFRNSFFPDIGKPFVSFEPFPENETLFPKSEDQNRILLIPRLERKI